LIDCFEIKLKLANIILKVIGEVNAPKRPLS
jgi:hypothetical protein